MEVRIPFDAPKPQPAAELIAEAFYAVGADGVIIEDPDLEPAEPWADDKVPGPGRHAVVAYLPLNHRYALRLAELQARLECYRVGSEISTDLTFRELDEEDWAQAWKAFFKPIRVAEHIVIRPSWESCETSPDDLVIEIDPGMAFGTGDHATTALCIDFIQSYLKIGDDFLDVGVGSGILCIVAAKLGAHRIVGVDIDETAVSVAKDNLRRNRIPENRTLLLCGRLIDALTGRFDLVAANLFSDVVIAMLSHLDRVLKPGATLICSGISEGQEQRVCDELKRRRMQVTAVRKKGEWVAVAARRPLPG